MYVNPLAMWLIQNYENSDKMRKSYKPPNCQKEMKQNNVTTRFGNKNSLLQLFTRNIMIRLVDAQIIIFDYNTKVVDFDKQWIFPLGDLHIGQHFKPTKFIRKNTCIKDLFVYYNIQFIENTKYKPFGKSTICNEDHSLQGLKEGNFGQCFVELPLSQARKLSTCPIDHKKVF